MKKFRVSIFFKIWLGISAMLIGYTFSMTQVQFGVKRFEHDLLMISSVFLPSSVFSQKALAGFKNQVSLYENAYKEGKPEFIKTAQMESQGVRDALHSLSGLNRAFNTRSLLINDLIESFEIYTHEVEKIQGRVMQNTKKMSFRKDEILYQLSQLEEIFSKDLQLEIDSTISFLKYQQNVNISVFLSVLLISLFSMWLITRRTIVMPIQDIVSQLKDVGKKGVNDFKLSVVDTWDEIGQLNTAFNNMMSEIIKSHEKINNYARQLETDIIERKKTEENLQSAYDELSKTQLQLVQSGKLASIGELAAGIAHELNQPLMVIRAAAQLSIKKLNKKNMTLENIAKQMEIIERNTKRMDNIIKHLRIFSRQSPLEFANVDINQVIQDSMLMAEEQLRIKNISVNKKLADKLPDCYGDANQIEQVFLNLITNARDAILEKTLQCRTDNTKYEGSLDIVTCVSDLHENMIEILFKDNGFGIPFDKIDKIFDPFFTTKDLGKGTGLGLSISYGIIKKHKGSIEIIKTSPEGTCIRLLIPIQKTAVKGKK